MKKICLFFTILLLAVPAYARRTIGLSALGGGNFHLIETFPHLDAGFGGGLGFEYRFNQHWGLQVSATAFSHDGKGSALGDNNLWLISVPQADLKFYFFKDERKFDPYASVGLGFSALTGGSIDNNSGGAGLSAQLGLGADYYFKDWISLGANAQFKTVALIRDSSQSSALIFMTLTGNLTFHFK